MFIELNSISSRISYEKCVEPNDEAYTLIHGAYTFYRMMVS